MGEKDIFEFEDPDKPGEFYEIEVPKGAGPPSAADIQHVMQSVKQQQAGQFGPGAPLAASKTDDRERVRQRLGVDIDEEQKRDPGNYWTDKETGDLYRNTPGFQPMIPEEQAQALRDFRAMRGRSDALGTERQMVFPADDARGLAPKDVRFSLVRRGSGRPAADAQPPAQLGMWDKVKQGALALPGGILAGLDEAATAAGEMGAGFVQDLVDNPAKYLAPAPWNNTDDWQEDNAQGAQLMRSGGQRGAEVAHNMVPLRSIADEAVSSKPQPPGRAVEMLSELFQADPVGTGLQILPAIPGAAGVHSAGRSALTLASEAGGRLLDTPLRRSVTVEVPGAPLLGEPPARPAAPAAARPGRLSGNAADQLLRNEEAAAARPSRPGWADEVATRESAAPAPLPLAATTVTPRKVKTMPLGVAVRSSSSIPLEEIARLTQAHKPAINALYKELQSNRDIPAGLRKRAQQELGQFFSQGKPLSPGVREAVLKLGGDGMKATTYRDVLGTVLDAVNAPKSIQYGLDVSAPVRQGARLAVTRPKIAAKAIRDMIIAMESEAGAAASALELASRANVPLWRKYGLAVEQAREGYTPSSDYFRSNLAEKIPGLGPLIASSERGYNAFLNRMRADVFDSTVAAWEKKGFTPGSHPEMYQGLADYINATTGHADLGKLEAIAPALNAISSSPRLLKSRLDLVGVMVGRKTPPAVRMMAARDSAAWLGAGMGLLGLAKLAGLEIGEDPEEPDFGKILIPTPDGKQATRLDIWGGYSQYARLVYLLGAGSASKDWDEAKTQLQRRGRAALSPTVGELVSQITGTKITGEETGPADLWRLGVPLAAQDLGEAMKEQGLLRGAAVGAPAFIGVGVSTYPYKRKRQ